MRQLATVQRIINIAPIDGADAIEKATILGWECVIKKSDGLKEGDLAVYLEIDAVVPPVEPFLFLAERKYRIKTIKLRGQISQGLCLPLSFFPQIKNPHEGQDVTELLGVTKYDPEAAEENRRGLRQRNVSTKPNPLREFFMSFRWFRNLHRKLYPQDRRGWPEFIHKTDETRLQNMPHVLAMEDKTFYAGEKCDGSSATYFVTFHRILFWKVATFGVCSRNLYLKVKHSCPWWNVADQHQIKEKLLKVGKDICIQGEIVGPGVQGNKYNLSNLTLWVFNVWDIKAQRYYTWPELIEFCETYGFTHVPIVYQNVKLFKTVQEHVEDANGFSALNPKVLREGLVWRSANNMPNGAPISFKVISPKFLLKHDL